MTDTKKVVILKRETSFGNAGLNSLFLQIIPQKWEKRTEAAVGVYIDNIDGVN